MNFVRKNWIKFVVVTLVFSICLFIPTKWTRGQTGLQHTIILSWTPPTQVPAFYGVYRGTVTGGPYTKIANLSATVSGSSTPVTSFSDSSGVGGTKYFFVMTSIDSSNFESAFSNEASGTQLANPNPPTGLAVVAK